MKSVVELTREAGGFDATPAFLERLVELVRADEREACAKVCESQPMRQDVDVRDQCADAIRAREQKT